MFEMSIVLLSTALLATIAYELAMMIRGREWGENASSIF